MSLCVCREPPRGPKPSSVSGRSYQSKSLCCFSCLQTWRSEWPTGMERWVKEVIDMMRHLTWITFLTFHVKYSLTYLVLSVTNFFVLPSAALYCWWHENTAWEHKKNSIISSRVSHFSSHLITSEPNGGRLFVSSRRNVSFISNVIMAGLLLHKFLWHCRCCCQLMLTLSCRF